MRRVIYSFFVSLDGYIEGPDGKLDWHVIDKELHTFANDQQNEIDTYLYGRRMYEVMSYWETADADPSAPEFELDFSRLWKRMPKVVFSRTLKSVGPNARLVSENIAEEVTTLKNQTGKDLELGGADIAKTFMQLNLIDEYRLFIHPVILGGGKPMFPSSDYLTKVQLVETHSFRSGVVYLRYQR